MSSIHLLDKTRKIGKLLHNNNSSKVVFNDICAVMSEILKSNVMVISRKGKILGISLREDTTALTEMLDDRVGKKIDAYLNERFLNVLSTKENVNLMTLGFTGQDINGYAATIAPIDIAGERLGTLFIYRKDQWYDIDDIILSEYGTTVVGLEMMRSVDEENEEEARKINVVRAAIKTMSTTELEAIKHVMEELKGSEGTLVASRIADRVGITRSVIVNALRKFESAGIIETKSAGMKGTFIRVINDSVMDEL